MSPGALPIAFITIGPVLMTPDPKLERGYSKPNGAQLSHAAPSGFDLVKQTGLAIGRLRHINFVVLQHYTGRLAIPTSRPHPASAMPRSLPLSAFGSVPAGFTLRIPN